MSPMITIARYSLLRAFLDRMSFLVGLLMPAAMMFVLGISIGGGEATIVVDVIDQDNSTLSQQFVALLQAEMNASASDESNFRLCAYHAPGSDCGLDDDLPERSGDWLSTADDRLESAEAYGVVILEPGFGERVRAGEQVAILFKNNNDLAAPSLAEQKINAAITRFSGAIAVADLVVSTAAEEFGGLEVGSPERAEAFDRVRAEVEAAWETRPVQVRASSTTGTGLPTNGFNQSGPGVATMFVLMFMLHLSTMLLTERETGTLARLYSLPVPRASVLGGILLGHYLYGLLQYGILIVVGSMMGVEWGGNLPGLLLIVVIFTFTATSLGLALGTVVRTSAQAASVSTLLGLTLSPFGGAWWPLEIVPRFMNIIGHISPVAWAMDAFKELMWYNGGVVDILPMLAVLAGMGAALFALGVKLYRYE